MTSEFMQSCDVYHSNFLTLRKYKGFAELTMIAVTVEILLKLGSNVSTNVYINCKFSRTTMSLCMRSVYNNLAS